MDAIERKIVRSGAPGVRAFALRDFILKKPLINAPLTTPLDALNKIINVSSVLTVLTVDIHINVKGVIKFDHKPLVTRSPHT